MIGPLMLLLLLLPGHQRATGVRGRASGSASSGSRAICSARPRQVSQDQQRVVTTTVTRGTRPASPAHSLQRLVVLVLDLSGSMAGGLLDRVLDACLLVTKRLSPTDYVVIWGFNSTATRMHCGLVGNLDFARLRRDMKKECGGITALFDAISEAHRGLADARRGKPPCLPFLIVFTDGGDNCSSSSSSDVRTMLQRSPLTNLRTIFITAGLSPGDAAAVRSALPATGHMLQAGTDDGSIKAQFRRAGNMVHVGSLEVTVTDTASNTRSRITVAAEAPSQQRLTRDMSRLAAQFTGSFALGGSGSLPALTSMQRPAQAVRPRLGA